ncbi:MAG: hypothetical protein KGN84_16505 [Acidobacteriota bacterium]|nr:hypothetical protein [Acidobacteriota bacterium]
MDCERNTQALIETARSGSELSSGLKSHVRGCEACAERWHGENELSAALRPLRAGAAGMRSPALLRQTLLNEFDARKVKTMTPRWYWGAAIAAGLLLAVAVVPAALSRLDPAPRNTTPAYDFGAFETEAEADGFIAVPYAPPLADGEMMRMVHTELNPAALASLGVSVDPLWTAQLPADLLLGEDGMPRAVRVADVESEEGGF